MYTKTHPNAQPGFRWEGRGLNQKIKFFCSKNILIRQRVEQAGATKACHPLGDLCDFFLKNNFNYLNDILHVFRAI